MSAIRGAKRQRTMHQMLQQQRMMMGGHQNGIMIGNPMMGGMVAGVNPMAGINLMGMTSTMGAMNPMMAGNTMMQPLQMGEPLMDMDDDDQEQQVGELLTMIIM